MPKYIHERKRWPMFTWDRGALARQLADIRHQQGRLMGRMAELGFELKADADLHMRTNDVVKSSEIEGENLDRQQVRSSLARRLGVEIGALVPADRRVDGVVEMMVDATRNYEAKLTVERLFGWHSALFPGGRSGMLRIRVGDWRRDETGPMQVVSGAVGRERVHYEAPAAERIPGEMKTFLKWVNAGATEDLVTRAALAHLWFLTIHPFEDGNGRIARAIADMLLARSEASTRRFYSMSTQIREERERYYVILESTQKGNLDVTQWLEWFYGCLERAIAHAEHELADVFRRAHFWRSYGGLPFNGRQREMLRRLLDGFEGKLTSSKWARICKCSQDTAARDIRDLMDRGILVRNPAGGRSTSYSLREFDAGE